MPIKRLGAKGGSTQATRSGKNYFDASKINNANIEVLDNGKTIKMPVVTAGNGITSVNKKLSELCPNLKVGDVVYLIFDTNFATSNQYIYLNSLWYNYNYNPNQSSRTITQEDLDATVILYGNRYTEGETEQVILSNFRIVKNIDDEWEQYGASPTPPFPSPIISKGESWNKLDESKVKTTTAMNGISWRYKNNKINIYGTATSTYSQSINVDIDLEEGTYSFFTKNNSNNNLNYNIWLFNQSGEMIGNTKLNNPVTITEKATKFIVFVEVIVTGTIYDETVNIQLVEGTEEKPYREYGYNLFVEKKSKNEFDDNKAYDLIRLTYSNGIYSASDNDTRSSLQYKIQQYNNSTFLGADSQVTKVISNTGKYYFTSTKVENANNIRIANAGTTYEFNLRYPLDNIAVGEKFTVVIDVIDITIGASKFKDVMLLKGEITEADYEEYFYDTYTIPMKKPLNGLPNETHDSLEKDGIHRRVGSVIFDGSDDENWILNNINNPRYPFGIDISDSKISSDMINMYSNQFVASTSSENDDAYADKETFRKTTYNQRCWFFIPKKYFSGTTSEEILAEFKNMISENPIEVTYELAEPITEELTEEQKSVINSIATEKGTTYFRNLDGSEMEIEYYKDLQALFNKVVSE